MSLLSVIIDNDIYNDMNGHNHDNNSNDENEMMIRIHASCVSFDVFWQMTLYHQLGANQKRVWKIHQDRRRRGLPIPHWSPRRFSGERKYDGDEESFMEFQGVPRSRWGALCCAMGGKFPSIVSFHRHSQGTFFLQQAMDSGTDCNGQCSDAKGDNSHPGHGPSCCHFGSDWLVQY